MLLNLEKRQDCPIFSIDSDEVARLNALFWQQDSKARNNIVAFSRVGSASAATTIIAFGTPVLAAGGGTPGGSGDAAATIATNVEAAINMIRAIDGIGTAAFAAALAPLGFMLTLRVLNMVLSRV